MGLKEEIGLGDWGWVVFKKEDLLNFRTMPSPKGCTLPQPPPPAWLIVTNSIPTDKRGNVCFSFWYRLFNPLKVEKLIVIRISSLI